MVSYNKSSRIFTTVVVGAMACGSIVFTSNAQAEPIKELPKKPAATGYQQGKLPVGDMQITTDKAVPGKVFLCKEYAQNISKEKTTAPKGEQFSTDGKWFDPSKVTVQSNTTTKIKLKESTSGDKRILTADNSTTGSSNETDSSETPTTSAAPSQSNNPGNTAKIELPLKPKDGKTPSCVTPQVGFLLDSGPLYVSVDAAGKDSIAWGTQELPKVDTDEVIGYALDGYPITGSKAPGGGEYSSKDLDECHGGVGPIKVNGKEVNSYHYVLTKDYPYTISCFKGETATGKGAVNAKNSGEKELSPEEQDAQDRKLFNQGVDEEGKSTDPSQKVEPSEKPDNSPLPINVPLPFLDIFGGKGK